MIQRIAAAGPTLDQRLMFYWNAFQDLASDRANGAMSLGPIPRWTIRAYAREELDLTPSETRALLKVITGMDHTLRTIIAEKPT